MERLAKPWLQRLMIYQRIQINANHRSASLLAGTARNDVDVKKERDELNEQLVIALKKQLDDAKTQ